MLREDVADRAEFRERFLREARIAASLDHPNIVRVHDYGVAAGVQYLVMDDVDADTLGDRMAGLPSPRRLADATIRRAVREVAAALDHAHQHGVVHRDLKPANVLVRRADQRALLTDFGIARSTPDQELTRTERSLGTYAYMSPEQCRAGEPLTPRSDVYAFAALLFELATGRPPYGHGLPAIAGHLAAEAPVASAREVDPTLPADLDAVLRRGLARRPADRPGSAGEMAAAFDAAASRAAPARGMPRRWLLAGAALLGLGGAAAAAGLALRPPPGPAPDAGPTAAPTPGATLAQRRSWPRYDYAPDRQSEVVRAIQLLLLSHRLDIGPGPDGFFGSYTENAVLQFQRESALPADGSVADATWEKLVVVLGQGARGSAVEAVQRLLRARDPKLALSPNGSLGASTEAAVKAVQRASRLPQTGRVDVDTWCVLVGGRIPPPTSQRSAAPGGQASAAR